jgi:hypothetical protein
MVDQKKVLGEKLKELNKQITTGDRQAYREEFTITPENLSVYLNGNGVDIEKSMAMLEFFQNRINARNEKIKELVK